MAHRSHDRLDKALPTRNTCIAGLCASWMFGMGGIVGGAYCVYQAMTNHVVLFTIPHVIKDVLPLGLNVLVTLLNESMGYIHTTTLRWSIQYENRLTFNSNLRLLSSSKRSTPNKWYSNLGFLCFIVLSYATTSLIFQGWNQALLKTFDSNETVSVLNNRKVIEVSGTALIFFGISLSGQAILATWALATTNVPTWSSNPLDTVYACTDPHSPNKIARRKDRCMKSVHDILQDSQPCYPKKKQGPACTAHREVKWVLALLWALVPLGGLWGGAIHTMIIRGNPRGLLGRYWGFLPTFTGSSYNSTEAPCPAFRCTEGTSVLNVGWTASSGILGSIGSIFLIAGFQGGLTLALHCAELLVNLSRDEGIFRMAISPKGTDPRYSSIFAAFTSWQTITLFAFKAAVHWLFGLAINNHVKLGVNMYPPQIFYFTAFALLVAIFATYVSLRRPNGPMPATFGHLQTMADLIDGWDACMFWGHKDDGPPNYAGTSSRPLPMPRMNELYGGVAGMERESVDLVGGPLSMESLLAAEHDMRFNNATYYNEGMYQNGGLYSGYGY